MARFFSRLKPYHRLATRYEKTRRNDLGFVQIARTLILLQESPHDLARSLPRGLFWPRARTVCPK